jgi:hypothetical protein
VADRLLNPHISNFCTRTSFFPGVISIQRILDKAFSKPDIHFTDRDSKHPKRFCILRQSSACGMFNNFEAFRFHPNILNKHFYYVLGASP